MHPPDKKEPHSIHRLYVLRLWRDGPTTPWRVSVKEVAEGKELHFASLENLYIYLQSETTLEPTLSATVANSDPTRNGD